MTQKSLTFDECKQLSSRIIAMNPNRRANMGQISSHLLDYYTELTKQPWLAQLVGQIRDLTAQQNQMMQEEMKAGETYQQLDRKITDLKKQLPFRSPHYFHFFEDHRAQKFIDPEAFTFQTTVDIDNPEEVEPAVKNALLLNGMFDEPTEKLFREKIFSAEDIELWKGKVLHIERSARSGASQSSANASSQSQAFQNASSAPTVDFEPIESEEEKARRAANAVQYEQTYDGVPYGEIVKALVELMGGAPVHGNRNNFIYREACLLRYICNSEAAWIKQVIETFGEDEAKAFATVENACKMAQSTAIPDLVKQAVETARKNHLAKQATEKAGIYADVPPQLPAKLPKLIKLLTSKVPADFKAAVAMAVFPALAAHLKGVTFRYTDNQVHEAAMMNLLIAAMSSGKSLVNGPIDCIIEDLVQMDKVNRQKEQDWKDEVNTMGDNKKKPVRPEDICIRIVSPDLTRAAYIQRLDDVQKAGDAYLYCKMDEVDMLRKFNDPSQLIRLCWDNSEDGQERVGTKSVTARVKTRFNWNASSTIAVTQKFFSVREVADGAVSRLTLATIIRPDFAPRPEVGSYDAQFKSQLSPYIQQLNAASGFKDCRKARQLIERLENEIMEMAQLAYNKPYAEFAKRGLANGFRRAMVLYLANGEKWEKAIEDFIVWSVKYDLWCKMRFFGNQMQEAIDADSRSVCHTPGVSNLLLYVHDTFDKTEIQNICQVHGTKTKLAILLCNWKKRGFIMKNEDGTFTKTARFIAKYGHYGTPGVAA